MQVVANAGEFSLIFEGTLFHTKREDLKVCDFISEPSLLVHFHGDHQLLHESAHRMPSYVLDCSSQNTS